MRKIISIGESCLEVLFRGEVPVKSYPGGELLNASACMGSDGVTVDYVSEVARDRVGDIVSGFLESHGVSVKSIDRYTEGTTPFQFLCRVAAHRPRRHCDIRRILFARPEGQGAIV